MRTEQDLERAVRVWVEQGSDQLPDPALDAALDRIATTKQRHAGWLARRTNLMNGNALKLGLAAVAIVAVALLGVRFLPSMVGGPPDPTPTPTSVTLASGSFTADLSNWGQALDIEATRVGDDVSGTLEVSGPEGAFAVDLECSQTTDDGLLVIGGAVTESTNEIASQAVYGAIALAPGTPARTILFLDVVPDDVDPSPADSCSAYLETMLSDPEFGQSHDGPFGAPITGDLELNP
jgi:hypothetical protein